MILFFTYISCRNPNVKMHILLFEISTTANKDMKEMSEYLILTDTGKTG
jgi:hypothetical protein